MFDELVRQAKKLFSSKCNGGKQVPKLTDRLHTHKQILLALSMVLLIGYSQFRDHFDCETISGVDKKTLTNFCLTNGTTTVIQEHGKEHEVPHVGLHYKTNGKDYRVIGHNYMRSLWALLILLSLCSYFAQRKWATIFENDVLQAILQLHGSEESKLVKAADTAKPYLMLLKSFEQETTHEQGTVSDRVSHKIDFMDNHVNIYDHRLDYYPNQLTYLLLTKNVAAYKLSCLKLRRKLIVYSLWSTCFTLMQFVLPLLFIGAEYMNYGWRSFMAFLSYVWKLLTSDVPILVNSIDYELSSSIFPITTQCQYQQYGMAGEIEKVTVLCTVAINEICGKLFVAIWWFVVINIIIEIISLAIVVICSVNSSTIRLTYGLRYWPGAREQADFIATFRCRRQEIMKRQRQTSLADTNPIVSIQSGHDKRVEAEMDVEQRPKRWFQMSSQDCLLPVFEAIINAICCCTNLRRQSLEQEARKDINIYYLLYLVYLRLGKSKSKIEEVIRMTATALNNYLDDLQPMSNVEHDSKDKIKNQLLTQFEDNPPKGATLMDTTA